VLRVLEAAGITAYSGWRYLATLPAEARADVVERLPHLLGGVLLNNAPTPHGRVPSSRPRGCCRAPRWPSDDLRGRGGRRRARDRVRGAAQPRDGRRGRRRRRCGPS
jgi:hypothetical protein